jgi:hypothetical protein
MSDVRRLDELCAHTELGEEARTFVKGQLGEILIGMARQEAAAAKEELAVVCPRDEKKITDLQTQVWRGEKFEQWLAELIQKGNEALQEFKQMTGTPGG